VSDRVDVVIPYAGSAGALQALLARLAALELDRRTTVFVADNRPLGEPPVMPPADGPVRLIRAPGKRSSYHARNRAAAAGDAPWLLFLDADVEWRPALIAAYFDPPPADRTAVLAGGISDGESQAPGAAERYAVAARTMSEDRTLPRGYAQTANCLVRRAAFEQAGGFEDAIRSGGDADLCFRLQNGGWRLEHRPAAAAVHRSRTSVVALLRQKARHGGGAAWLERRYPGRFPRRRWLGLARWSMRELTRPHGPLSVATVWAFELGRLLPNR
jgi:GT2 family glycosyltransferase